MTEKRCKTGGCWTKPNGDHTGVGCGCDCHQTLQVPTPDTKPVKGLGEATKRPWAIDRGSIWEKENPPRKGHVVASVETAFSSITIRALPNNLACPSKAKLDQIGEADAALIVEAVNSFDGLTQRVKVLEEALGKIAARMPNQEPTQFVSSSPAIAWNEGKAIRQWELGIIAREALAPPVGEKEPPKP